MEEGLGQPGPSVQPVDPGITIICAFVCRFDGICQCLWKFMHGLVPHYMLKFTHFQNFLEEFYHVILK